MFFDPIIFDPSALIEHVQQVVQLGQQVDSMSQQVQDSLKELAHLRSGTAPNEPAIVLAVSGQLNASVYDTSTPGPQLNQTYPTNADQTSWTQFQADEATWSSAERQSLIENRQVQNQIGRDVDSTSQQVQRDVDASNAAPGETAAAQAHNDLLAIASGELAKLQALRIARSRLRTDRLAREQSESAYAAAEQSRVRGDWSDPAAPTTIVADPFQD